MILEFYHNGETNPWIHWENVTKIEGEKMGEKPDILTIHIYRHHSYCCSHEINLNRDWYILHD